MDFAGFAASSAVFLRYLLFCAIAVVLLLLLTLLFFAAAVLLVVFTEPELSTPSDFDGWGANFSCPGFAAPEPAAEAADEVDDGGDGLDGCWFCGVAASESDLAGLDRTSAEDDRERLPS